MTGFSKAESKKDGYVVTVELKSLNGRYLEMNTRLPKNLTHKEFEIRDLIKKTLCRGTVSCFINFEYEANVKPFDINLELAKQYYESLKKLKTKLKIAEAIKMSDLLTFAPNFSVRDETDNSETEWKLTKDALSKAINQLDMMRKKEGQQIAKDMNFRMKKIADTIEKVDAMSLEKIPQERDRLRMRVAQLFESDEIDEHRIQMELVLLSDKLDISEECVRMRSHIKFYNQATDPKENDSVGKKLNFLLQEMNREVNTIGSKCSDAEIAQLVMFMKEELERIREQVQNIE